jgi:hypothetical protein
MKKRESVFIRQREGAKRRETVEEVDWSKKIED